MKKIISLVLAIALLSSGIALLFSCGDTEDTAQDTHVCEIPELTVGDNGNWYLGSTDTGVATTLPIVNTETEFVTIGGTDYFMVTLTFSDGSKKTVSAEMPKSDSAFSPTVSITNGQNGANGIVCVMTALDSGEFDTIYLLDELYIKYGLVSGLATVVNNLYTDSTYTTPDAEDVARTRQFLDTGRWRLVCHSLTHKSYGTGQGENFVIDEQRLYDEIVKSRDLLRELFPDQRVLTYNKTGMASSVNNGPASMREPEKALIAENYIGARFVTGDPENYDEIIWNSIHDTLLSEKNLPDLLKNVEECATEGKFYAIYTHYVIEDELIESVGGQSGSWTTVSVAEELCKKINQYTTDGSLWCAQFEDAILYTRERLSSTVLASYKDGKISVLLTDKMDDEIYNFKLTARVSVPDSWQAVKITQGDDVSYAVVQNDGHESFVFANILPDAGLATIEPVATADVPKEEPAPFVPTPDKNEPAFDMPETLTFETLDGILGSIIKFDNAGNAEATLGIKTEGEKSYLEFSKPTGNDSPYMVVTAKTASAPTSFIVEMDLKLERTSSSGEFHLSLTNKSGGNPAYRCYINQASDKLTYVDFDNTKPTTSRYENVVSDIGAVPGDWFKLRIEYTLLSESEAKITVSINGNVILESSNYYPKDSAPINPKNTLAIHIKPSNAYKGTISIDNLTVKQV